MASEMENNQDDMFWLEFKNKVESVFAEVDGLSIDSQMRAAHILETALANLMGRVKDRLVGRVKKEPRDDIATKQACDTPTDSVRKSGRQRRSKTPFTLDEVKPITSTQNSQADSSPRKRGRPHKSGVIPDKHIQTPSESDSTPRRRGRRTKSELLAADDISKTAKPEASNSTDKGVNVSPRKRGRPPKSAVTDTKLVTDAADDKENEEKPLPADVAVSEERAEEPQAPEEVISEVGGLSEPEEDNDTSPDFIPVENVKTKEEVDTEVKVKKSRGQKRRRTNTEFVMKVRPKLKEGFKRRGRPRISDYVEGEYVTVKTPASHSCPTCSKVYLTRKALLSHLLMHEVGKSHMCEDCGKLFNTDSGLETHRRKFHVDDAALFKCPHCVFTSYSQESLDYHYKRSHDPNRERNYICELCGKAFHRDKSLQLHVQGVHSRTKKYSCSQCEYVTHFDGCLRAHMINKHSKDRKTYPCSLCGSVLSTHSEFITHNNRHSGLKPYSCQQCGNAFASQSQLSSHKRIHMLKEEECTLCHKRFTDKHKLKRHMVIHTDSKEHNCPFCTYSCNLESNLRKHCKNVHKKDHPPRRKLRISERMSQKADDVTSVQAEAGENEEYIAEVAAEADITLGRTYYEFITEEEPQKAVDCVQAVEDVSTSKMEPATQYIELKNMGGSEGEGGGEQTVTVVSHYQDVASGMEIINTASHGNIAIPVPRGFEGLNNIYIVPEDGGPTEQGMIHVAGDEVVIMAVDTETEISTS